MSSRPADPSSSVSAAPMEIDASGVISIDNGNIKKRIVKEGTGPTPTDRADVTVHYTGRLLDGTIFDSSKKRNEPFVFKIGAGRVIKGWDVGVATMRVGEHAFLTCSPEYAYGARGSPPTIPPNATLEFEVELLSFDNTQKVTEDGGVKKSVTKAGLGHNRPNDNAEVTVKYVGRVKGIDRPFVDHQAEPVTFKLGTDPNQIWGLEEGLKNMHVGEVSKLFVTPRYAFGEKGDAALKIPPNADLEFDVELIDFTKGPETSGMTFEGKLAFMTSLKEYGNGVFKLGQLERAEKVYNRVVKDVFPYEGGLEDEQKQQVAAVELVAISNHTLCKLKQQDWDGVVAHATAGLAIDPSHVKCRYYRAQAYLKLGESTKAEEDLRTAHAKDPNNKDVARELNALKAKAKAEKEKERKAFGGFFGKVALVTPEEERRAEEERKAAAEKAAREAAAADSSDDDHEVDSEAPDAEMKPADAEAPAKTDA